MMKRKLLPVESALVKLLDDEQGTFEGYASVFNGVDAYGDTIAPGAYADTLKNRERPIRMRWNHFGPVIGKYEDIHEDEKGLFVRGSLTPGHSVARDVYASMKHGAVTGMSIGYIPKEWERDEEKGTTLLKRIDLIEISIVEEPADLGAQMASIKSAIEDIENIRDLEAFYRDGMGLSGSAAKALVGRCKTVLSRDASQENNGASEMLAKINEFLPSIISK